MTPAQTLVLVSGWLIVIVVGLVCALILWRMFTGKIDLSDILSEPGAGGKASLSRLQFLIFTIVVALSLFIVIVYPTPPAFPSEIPVGLFALLGISGGTYVIAKGVESQREIGKAQAEAAKMNAQAELTKANAQVETARKS